MTNSTHDRDVVYNREGSFFDHGVGSRKKIDSLLYAGYGLALAHDQLYRFAGEVEGKRVLEYGCGNGYHSLRLVAKGASVTGIDLSKRRVARINRALAPHMVSAQAIAMLMNAERLGFGDNSFDMIFGTAILHHLELRRALPEIRRALKPGGVGVFLEARGDNFLINLYRKFTPSQRTPDEHPLVEDEFRLFRTYFEQVDIVGFYFTALLSFLLRGIWKNEAAFIRINRFLTGLDHTLIKMFPFLDRFCWVAVIRVKKIA